MASGNTVNTVTFVHTSDFQLGMTRWFLGAHDSDAQSRFDDSRLRAISRLGDLARETGAEFIVVAGDVFDANAVSDRTMNRALEAFDALPVPVYLLPGNHDPLLPGAALERAAARSNVTVLTDSEPVQVRPGVEIVGAPLLARYASEDLAAAAIRDLQPADTIRILVAHGQTEGRGEDNEALFSLPDLEAAVSSGIIDYVALGDTHSAQPVGSSGKIWFSGSPEVTDFHDRREAVAGNEVNSGKALVVGVDKHGAGEADVAVSEHTVGEWTFEAVHWDVADGDDVARVLAELDAYPAKDRTVIKYSLAGTLGLEATRELEEGLAERESTFGALYARERLMDLHLEPDADELANVPLAGYAQEAMTELLDARDPAARDAVNLLFRLSKEPK